MSSSDAKADSKVEPTATPQAEQLFIDPSSLETLLWSPPAPEATDPLTEIQNWMNEVAPQQQWANSIAPPQSGWETAAEEIRNTLHRLEGRLDQLHCQLRATRKEHKSNSDRNQRKMRGIRRDFAFFEGQLTHISSWGNSINNALVPLLDERLEQPNVVGSEEAQRIEDFFMLVDEGYPSASGVDSGESD